MPRGINPVDEARLEGRLWNPLVLNPSVWLDAADLSTITIATGVSEWRDKSRNGVNAFQGVSGLRPTYSTSGLSGGYAGIVFDGTDDSLIILTTAINNTTNGIYYVFQRNGAGTGDGYRPEIGVNTSTGGDAGAIHYVKNSNNLGASYPYFNNAGFYDLSSGTAYVTGVPNVMAFQSNTTGWGVWRNGTLEGTTTALGGASGVMNGLRLAQQQSPLRTSAITISEVLVVPNVNTSTRRLIEGYLAWKWGLRSNLPANHPFINRPPLIGD